MDRQSPTAEPELRPGAHEQDGVDLTLVRWMLSMSALERLRHVEAMGAACQRLQERNGVVPRGVDEQGSQR